MPPIEAMVSCKSSKPALHPPKAQPYKYIPRSAYLGEPRRKDLVDLLDDGRLHHREGGRAVANARDVPSRGV